MLSPGLESKVSIVGNMVLRRVLGTRMETSACVVQGFVGGMPWNAIGFATMWLQLLGFSDVAAAALTALFWGGTALGNTPRRPSGGPSDQAAARRRPAAHLPGQGPHFKRCCKLSHQTCL